MNCLLPQSVHVRRQTRFVARRSVSVQNSFIDRFIDGRNRRRQKILTRLFVACRERRTELFDLRAKTAFVAGINGIALDCLSDALFC